MITKIKPVSRVNIIAVIVTITGCLLALDIFQTPLEELSVPGIFLGILAAVSCGTFTVVTDLKGREMSFPAIIAGALTVNALLAAVINPGMFLRIPSFTLTIAVLFLSQALVTKILSIVTETRGVMRIGSEKATVVLALEVPFTLLIAFFTLGETMTPVQLAGVGLVIGSVLLLQRSK
jgi:drug/metabolite transporter (DMT)-like permease